MFPANKGLNKSVGGERTNITLVIRDFSFLVGGGGGERQYTPIHCLMNTY